MTSALDKTLQVLSTSRNEASLTALLTAFDAAEGVLFDGIVQTLVCRRNRAGHAVLVERWHTLSGPQRAIVSEGRGKMTAALRDAMLSGDSQKFRNACDMMIWFREFDLVSTLITLAEDKSHPHANAATQLVLQMVSLLGEMLHGQRDPSDRRDPVMLRSHVIANLERSVERYRNHRRAELIEAFVILGGTGCGPLLRIIDDPHHPCYMTVVNTLSNSQSTAVVNLLLGFLSADNPSLGILTVIAKRSDSLFLSGLFDFVSNEPSPKTWKNIRRIRSFPGIQAAAESIAKLSDHNQESCIHLLAGSGMVQEELLDVLADVLVHGATGSRVAACEALALIPGDRSNNLLVEHIHDDQPEVQAAVAIQLRDRHIVGTMSTLVGLLESPHEIVRDAARSSLSEFSLENFANQFDVLPGDARQNMAGLVRKVDLQLQTKLAIELQSDSRRNCIRAIEIAEVLGVLPEFGEELVELLEVSDPIVRATAADALQHCPSPEVQLALRQVASEQSSAVQLAAKNSLAALVMSEVPLPTGIPAEN